jgi:hypothetical protein
MRGFWIGVFTVVALVGAGVGFCMAGDLLERRWKLRRLRRRMSTWPEVTDADFCRAVPELPGTSALEMRSLFAACFRIEAIKISPAWRFREDHDLRGMDAFVFSIFAQKHSPDRWRDHTIFEFPDRPVDTIRELFLEAKALQSRG